jgi:DNA invertase Pin-like site-specific DNA recombinase
LIGQSGHIAAEFVPPVLFHRLMKRDGFPRPEKAIRDYAARNGLKVAKIFREKGVTGTKETMDRPAWAEMMTALHSNGVKTILIERLDRLSRLLIVQEAAIAELAKHGFHLVSTHEPSGHGCTHHPAAAPSS